MELNRIFSEKEQDKGREADLLKELSGILAWAVRGLENLNARGNPPVPDTRDSC